MEQIFLLNIKGCSGRAVKIREMSAEEVDQCQINASKLGGPDATNAEFGVARHREMNFSAVVGVTTAGGYKTLDEVLAAGESAWTKVNHLMLEQGPFCYSTLFKAKDDMLISNIVQKIHTVTAAEIEAIMGKALTVSEG